MSLPSVYLPHNSIGERTLYMNCGYWAAAPQTYDQACEDLVELVADGGKITASDVVLDVGFGYGDQDAYLMRRYGPAKIIGLNISPYQVEEAKKRLAGQPRAEHIDLRVGDAVKTGLPDSSIDVVLAVECSAHFHTREAFLQEALRVLKPGGRLAMADVLLTGKRLKPISKIVVKSLVDFWDAPKGNMYALDTYKERLSAAGFKGVEARSVREHVFQPLMGFVRQKVVKGEMPRRMDLGLRLAYKVVTFAQSKANYQIPLDYAVASAFKG